jgi:hypothetical protein
MQDASAVLSHAHILSQAGHHAEAVKATDEAAAMIEAAQAQYMGLLAQLQLHNPQAHKDAGLYNPQGPQPFLACPAADALASEPPAWTHVGPPAAVFPLPQFPSAPCNNLAAPGVPPAALDFVQAVAAQWVPWMMAADDTEGEPEVTSTWRPDQDSA